MAIPLLPHHRTQWLALLLIWLVLAMLIGTSLLYMRRVVIVTEQNKLAEHARIIDTNLQHQLGAVNAALLGVIRDLAASPTPSDLDKTLDTLSSAMAGVRTILVLDSAGNVLGCNRAELLGGNFAKREYVQAAQSNPRDDVLYLSKPFRSVLNVYSMTLSRATLTAGGALHRIVSATLDPDFFEVLLASVRYDEDVRIFLSSGGGRIAMMVPQIPGLLGYELDKEGSLFRRHKDSGSLATVFEGRQAASGEHAWLAQRTIDGEAFNMTDSLVIAISRNPEKALDGWRRIALADLLVWLLSGIAASLVLKRNQRHQAQVLSLLAEQETLRERVENEIRQLAFYDPLTQLPNRRLLLDRLQQLMAASVRHGRLSVLLFIDLDGFKQVNDAHGHEAGDLLLKEVASRLSDNIREEDTVARLGGDEFVVMLAEMGPDAEDTCMQAERLAEKLLAALSRDYRFGALHCRCSASIGITLFGDEHEPHEAILRRADSAMYEAKLAGRNTYKIATPQRQLEW